MDDKTKAVQAPRLAQTWPESPDGRPLVVLDVDRPIHGESGSRLERALEERDYTNWAIAEYRTGAHVVAPYRTTWAALRALADDAGADVAAVDAWRSRRACSLRISPPYPTRVYAHGCQVDDHDSPCGDDEAISLMRTWVASHAWRVWRTQSDPPPREGGVVFETYTGGVRTDGAVR